MIKNRDTDEERMSKGLTKLGKSERGIGDRWTCSISWFGRTKRGRRTGTEATPVSSHRQTARCTFRTTRGLHSTSGKPTASAALPYEVMCTLRVAAKSLTKQEAARGTGPRHQSMRCSISRMIGPDKQRVRQSKARRTGCGRSSGMW